MLESLNAHFTFYFHITLRTLLFISIYILCTIHYFTVFLCVQSILKSSYATQKQDIKFINKKHLKFIKYAFGIEELRNCDSNITVQKATYSKINRQIENA